MAQDAGQAKVKKAMENDTVPQGNFSLIFYKVKALVPALNGQVNCPCACTAGVCQRIRQSIFNVKML